MNELKKILQSAREDIKKAEEVSDKEQKARQKLGTLLQDLNFNIQKWQEASNKVANKGIKKNNIKSIEAQILMKDVRNMLKNFKTRTQELASAEQIPPKTEEKPVLDDGFSLVSDMFITIP